MQAAARELIAARRRDYLMVTLMALFPLMLAQFAVSVIALRFADTSQVVALAPLQIAVLIATFALVAASLWLVIAVLAPFVRAAGSGEEITADDALREFPRNVRSAGRGLPGALPRRPLAVLLAAVAVVIALTTWLTGNDQTIGTAFVMMVALMLVATALLPLPAVMVLLERSGFVPPEAPEVTAQMEPPPAAPDPNAATSTPAPGSSGPAQPEVAPSPAPPATAPGKSVPPPPTSVPPPPSS